MTLHTRMAGFVAALVTTSTLVATAGAAPAQAAVTYDGSSPERAAASCWEIKQNDPTAPSGTFWLVTPKLQTPTPFYCDQSTAGGGWVLIARGRHGWQEGGDGRGTPASVASTITGPSAFFAKQLPSKTIDAVLNGGRVDQLADGIRLKRSTNQSGTTTQDLRIKLASRSRWTWALAASPGIPVASYSVNGSVTSKAQTTRDMTLTTDSQRTLTSSTPSSNYVRGFLYGKNGPLGSPNDSSYLYSTVSGGHYAAPFTQVWLRPKLMTPSMGYASIPDSGTPAQAAPAIPESGALPQPWGVTGLGNGGSLDYATEVSAFAQIGNRVYVGGNFTRVRKSDGSQQYRQPYLAAFDATTGSWISSFRPLFNNQVKALAALPNGKLAVGGQFSKLDGRTATNLVVLDPISGRRYSTFRATFGQTTSGAKRWVRSLDVSGPYLYVGGGFTTYRGGTSTKTRAFRNILRVSAANGSPSTGWRPNLGAGIVQPNGKRSVSSSVLSLDVSDDGSRVYAAGQFQQGYVGDDGKAAVSRPGAAAIRTTTPATFQSWSVRYSTANKLRRYQQTVKRVGSRVWLGGSQHSFFSYTSSTLKLAASNITFSGGDLQAAASRGNVVYGSCHCNQWNYSGTTSYDSKASGYRQVDRIGYVGAWDAATGSYYPEFAPTSKMRAGEGPWALMSASDGTLWSGGDYVSVVDRDGKNQSAGGFARFAMRPHTPPAAPSSAKVSLTGSTATVSWTPSATRGVSYEVLRNNKVVEVTGAGATSVAVDDSTGADRFFVRASDGQGNRSASTRVARPGSATTTLISSTASWAYWFTGTTPPSDWKTSTDDAGWTYGEAPLGFGAPGLKTTLARPSGGLRAYFRRSLDIDDVSAYSKLVVTTRADDGAVVIVNGTEVTRRRVTAGVVPASSAIATSAAAAETWTFEIDPALLHDGKNRIAVDVRLHDAGTADMTHQLTVVGTLR
ncbi:MAG: hypothetical protein JWP31_2323 [Aeromicrobium sp.]|nr:hypothetical protein [Aeromicrobium sp.]